MSASESLISEKYYTRETTDPIDVQVRKRCDFFDEDLENQDLALQSLASRKDFQLTSSGKKTESRPIR